MASEIENITTLTRGNDVTLEFTVTSTEAIVRARFMVKKRYDDLDAAARIDKEVTTSLTADGQITGAGPYVIAIFLTQDDTADDAVIEADKAYKYDLEVFNADDEATTPMGGTITFRERVRLAVGV